MPDIIITLNQAQVDRVKLALAVSTAAEVAAILKEELKNIVTNVERKIGRDASEADVTQLLIDEGW